MTQDLTRAEIEEIARNYDDEKILLSTGILAQADQAIIQLLAQLDAANAKASAAGRAVVAIAANSDARADAAAEQMRAQCVEMATSQAILTRHQMKASFLTTTTSYLLDRQRSLTAYKIADDIAALAGNSPEETVT